MEKRWRVACFRFLPVACLLVIGLAAPAQAQRGRELVTINAGILGIMSGDSGFIIAKERGYFQEQGLEVVLQRFDSGATIMAPLAGGQLDVGQGGTGIGTFNGIKRGFPIIAVANTVILDRGNGNAFMVRSDLKNEIVKVSDLKGRKVAINAMASPLLYSLGMALETGSLSLKDVTLATMPFPDLRVAFKNKAIDMGINVEPLATLVARSGEAVIWKKTDDFVNNPYQTIGSLFYNVDWARKNPDAANRFMIAFLKGVRDYHDAMTKRVKREEVIGYFIKHTGMKDRAIYDLIPWGAGNPDGYESKESVLHQQDWYFKNGYLDSRLPIEKFVDDRYVDHAISVLGKYKK